MEKLIVYGSSYCPITQDALSKLKEKNIEFEFKNISGELKSLKEFLNIRDTNTFFNEIRGTGLIGIPCFILRQGEITLDLDVLG